MGAATARLDPDAHGHHLGDDELLASLRELWPSAVLVVRYGRERDDIQFAHQPRHRRAPAHRRTLDGLEPETLHAGGANGYTDYPTLAHA